MARSRYRFAEPHRPHFLTCTVVEWLPVFTRPEAAEVIFETWRHQQKHAGLVLFGYVVMENHLHAVAQAETLPEVWAQFKSYTARKMIAPLEEARAETLLKRFRRTLRADRGDRTRQFWQEGSHPQVIMNHDMLRQKLDYMHYNPVKRGFVELPEHWLWSSARCYLDMEGPVEVCRDW